jgi:hypothetical protein
VERLKILQYINHEWGTDFLTMERRNQTRAFRILPIRYKQKGESTYMVGEVIDLTKNGFCLIMPVDLEIQKEFEFEAFEGNACIRGLARVEWMERGNMKAGCSYRPLS